MAKQTVDKYYYNTFDLQHPSYIMMVKRDKGRHINQLRELPKSTKGITYD